VTDGHADAIALIDAGEFDDAVEYLTRAVAVNARDHEALFLIGCLCFEGNEVDAQRAFSAAADASPDDLAYRLFERLAQIKLRDPRFEGTGVLACIEQAAEVMRRCELTPFAMAILVRLFDLAGRRDLAADGYERILRAQGRDATAAAFAQCRNADARWPWDETVSGLRREIRERTFGDEDLTLWLALLPAGTDQKVDALRRVLVQTLLTHRRSRDPGRPGLFGLPPLAGRCLTVTQVSDVGWGTRGDIWISPPRREWDVNVIANSETMNKN
jgi:tetratricopeptide (TPR) repeat protein